VGGGDGVGTWGGLGGGMAVVKTSEGGGAWGALLGALRMGGEGGRGEGGYKTGFIWGLGFYVTQWMGERELARAAQTCEQNK
jgi:hypothetical protein